MGRSPGARQSPCLGTAERAGWSSRRSSGGNGSPLMVHAGAGAVAARHGRCCDEEGIRQPGADDGGEQGQAEDHLRDAASASPPPECRMHDVRFGPKVQHSRVIWLSIHLLLRLWKPSWRFMSGTLPGRNAQMLATPSPRVGAACDASHAAGVGRPAKNASYNAAATGCSAMILFAPTCRPLIAAARIASQASIALTCSGHRCAR